jgi:hypothetical protein
MKGGAQVNIYFVFSLIYKTCFLNKKMDSQCTRLQTENVKGTVSSIALFPENRLLLFGSENGNIELLC